MTAVRAGEHLAGHLRRACPGEARVDALRASSTCPNDTGSSSILTSRREGIRASDHGIPHGSARHDEKAPRMVAGRVMEGRPREHRRCPWKGPLEGEAGGEATGYR